jgi:hypothetical protein
MGQTYPFNKENDELLSEAEKAFDLSARRESMLKDVREIPEAPPRRPILKSLAGLFFAASGGAQS